MVRRLWRWLLGVDPDRYAESTEDLLRRKSIEAGIDPAWVDEILNLPPEPGSLGPGDPGRLW